MATRALKAYFNHGGLARPHERVARRVRTVDREFAGLLFSEDGGRRLDATLDQARVAARSLVGAGERGGVSLLSNSSTALNLAISILIMRGIFETISSEIADAAKIDGASSFRTLSEIMLPLIANGLVVLVIVNFVSAWGEYLLAATLTNDQSVRTLPVVLATTFGGFGEWAWPRISAVYIMAITPGIVAFALAQRWYMKGLLEGALKV